jgi:hypothetical protein
MRNKTSNAKTIAVRLKVSASLQIFDNLKMKMRSENMLISASQADLEASILVPGIS